MESETLAVLRPDLLGVVQHYFPFELLEIFTFRSQGLYIVRARVVKSQGAIVDREWEEIAGIDDCCFSQEVDAAIEAVNSVFRSIASKN